jgi:hypothetical protein
MIAQKINIPFYSIVIILYSIAILKAVNLFITQAIFMQDLKIDSSLATKYYKPYILMLQTLIPG